MTADDIWCELVDAEVPNHWGLLVEGEKSEAELREGTKVVKERCRYGSFSIHEDIPFEYKPPEGQDIDLNFSKGVVTITFQVRDRYKTDNPRKLVGRNSD